MEFSDLRELAIPVETDGTPGNWVNAHPQGTNGVLEVDGTLVSGGGSGPSVPEPGNCVLLNAGLLGLIARLNVSRSESITGATATEGSCGTVCHSSRVSEPRL
jgi:hypothetical protein